MARIGLSPYLGYLIVEENFNLALGIFALAGLTDLLDGYIARNWANQKSVLGSALDPLADKILISVLYISLTYAGLLPVALTAMVILRDIVLIAAVFHIRYKTVPPPLFRVICSPCEAYSESLQEESSCRSILHKQQFRISKAVFCIIKVNERERLASTSIPAMQLLN
ncbi:cardiolipin synthase (CMP-forming) isoform X2 [Protopterus annectens]|uniref:cardiolipin synthase (CMP-forming) isoform X2 n=1 Tax=Protopterus annectens TaxID=7888 RepID=UPI001CFA7BAA|nr:cardiolipin synthase (CMP-forming) isoform X2 [Protopterus annectens]